jgi:LysR family glycine cleavage system transcriptional activator
MASMLNRTPLTALRSFEAAARKSSFNEAAEELGVTPAAVSLQIRRLEERIGRPLFVRGRRSLELSETGARLAPQLTRLFSDLERLLSDVLAPETASLRVSAMPSFASKWLAPRLARFAALRPEYNVRVEGEDALATFDRDDVDIGLRYGPGGYAGLFHEHVAEAHAFPVCSPAFAAANPDLVASPRALASAPLLHDEIALRASGLPTWGAWFAAAGVEAPALRGPRFESLHMALSAAIAGQGVALGLSPIVDDDMAAGRLVRLFDIEAPSAYAFWLVCRADRADERKIAAFRRWIAREAGGGRD